MTEEELNLLFADGLAYEAGDLVPLPSMPLLAPAPGPDMPSVAEEVEEGRRRQRVTGEKPQVPADVVHLKVGMELKFPDGEVRKITGIYHKGNKVRIGTGSRRNRAFWALDAVQTVNNQRLIAEMHKQAVEEARIQDEPPPPPMVLPPWPMPEGIRDYQVEQVAFLERRRRAILAAEMGLGKTLMGTMALHPPALVVCPRSLKPNWAAEINRWRPGLTVSIVSGGGDVSPDVYQADVVIMNYDILEKHLDFIINRRFQTLIADEAHFLKNLDLRWNKVSKELELTRKGPIRARAFYQIQLHIPRLFLLSGTPIPNRPKELWPLLVMVDYQTWNNRLFFCQRYCGGKFDVVTAKGGEQRTTLYCDGCTNAEELYQRTHNIYMSRLTKAAVLTELPDKQRNTIVVEMDADTAVKYHRARTEFEEWVFENGGPEAVMRASRAKALVQLNHLRKLAGIGKSPAAVEWIVDFFTSTQRPLVVAINFKETFAAVEGGLRKVNEAFLKGKGVGIPREMRVAVFRGGETERVREQTVRAFQNGEIDVLLFSVALGVGLTLTRSSDMLFMERLWRPADQAQMEDRIHRIGQLEKVMINYLEADGTIDADMAMLLVDKVKAAAAVVDGQNLDENSAADVVMGSMMRTIDRPARRLRSNPSAFEEPIDVVDVDIFDEDGERWDGGDSDD